MPAEEQRGARRQRDAPVGRAVRGCEAEKVVLPQRPGVEEHEHHGQDADSLCRGDESSALQNAGRDERGDGERCDDRRAHGEPVEDPGHGEGEDCGHRDQGHPDQQQYLHARSSRNGRNRCRCRRVGGDRRTGRRQCGRGRGGNLRSGCGCGCGGNLRCGCRGSGGGRGRGCGLECAPRRSGRGSRGDRRGRDGGRDRCGRGNRHTVGHTLRSQSCFGAIEADAPDQFTALLERGGGIRRCGQQLHGGRMPQVEPVGRARRSSPQVEQTEERSRARQAGHRVVSVSSAVPQSQTTGPANSE